MTLLSLYNLHCAKESVKVARNERVAATWPICLRSRWAWLQLAQDINNHETTDPSEVSLIGQFKTMQTFKICTLIGGDVDFASDNCCTLLRQVIKLQVKRFFSYTFISFFPSRFLFISSFNIHKILREHPLLQSGTSLGVTTGTNPFSPLQYVYKRRTSFHN